LRLELDIGLSVVALWLLLRCRSTEQVHNDKHTTVKDILAKFLETIVININEDQLRERMRAGQAFSGTKST
jgi:hypothetical protein